MAYVCLRKERALTLASIELSFIQVSYKYYATEDNPTHSWEAVFVLTGSYWHAFNCEAER